MHITASSKIACRLCLCFGGGGRAQEQQESGPRPVGGRERRAGMGADASTLKKHLETAEKTGALNLSGARPCPRPAPAAATAPKLA